MTRVRSWTALGALVLALAGSAVVADDAKCPATGCAKGKDCCKKGDCCPGDQPRLSSPVLAYPRQATGPCPIALDFTFPTPPQPTVSEIPMGLPPAPPVAQAPQAPQFTPTGYYVPVTQYQFVSQAPQSAPPLPSQMCQAIAPPPPAVERLQAPMAWNLRVVEVGGKSQLELSGVGSDGTTVTCENLVVKVAGESFKVAVAGKQVQIQGKCLKATAAAVTCGNGGVVLNGQAKVNYDGCGQKAEISADHVSVSVPDGHLNVQSAPKHAERAARQQLFNFYVGFGR